MLNDDNLNNRIVIKTRNHASHISLLAGSVHAMALLATGNEKCAMELQFAIVEALNNVFLHAYDGQPDHEITLTWQQIDRQLFIEIIDHGHSLTALPEPELPDPMSENGRGWWIIKHCVDRYFYEVIGCACHDKSVIISGSPEESRFPASTSSNILTLVKNF